MKFLPIIALFAVSHLFAASGLDGGIKIQYGANANTNIVTHVTISPADANGTNLMAATLQATNLLTLGAGATAATLQTDTNGTIQATSAASDGQTPYLFDTSVAHTSGNLMEVKNNGTNWYTLSGIAPILAVSKTTDNLSAGGVVIHDGGSPNIGNEVLLNMTDSLSAIWNTFLYQYDAGTGDVKQVLNFSSAGNNYLLLDPGRDLGGVPYVFNTTTTVGSGNLSEFKNNGTNAIQLTFDGAIKTAVPTGATNNQPFKIGDVATGTVTLVTTNYLQVEINGQLVKLGIVK